MKLDGSQTDETLATYHEVSPQGPDMREQLPAAANRTHPGKIGNGI